MERNDVNIKSMAYAEMNIQDNLIIIYGLFSSLF